MVASLFVTSFEMLKTSIQDRIKSFLCLNATLNEQGELEFDESEDYKTQVSKREILGINGKKLSVSYHLFYSSSLWLKESDAITQDDFDEIEKIRKHRNLIAHEPLKLLVDDNFNVNIELLRKSKELLTKIEKWWIIEVEIPLNPDFDGKKIDESEVLSGSMIFLNYLMEIANEEISR